MNVLFSANWVLLLALLFLPKSWAVDLTGYDCTSKNANYTVYSLDEVAACPKAMEHKTNQTIQVLQTKQYLPTMVKQCRLRETRTIGYCGIMSWAAIPSSFFRHYIPILGKEDCKKVHKTKLFKFRDAFLLDNLKINETTRFNLQLAGSSTPGSVCEAGTYTEDEITYTNVQVQATLDFLLV